MKECALRDRKSVLKRKRERRVQTFRPTVCEETERGREKDSVAISVGFTLFTSCSSCFAMLACRGLIIYVRLRTRSVHVCLRVCVFERGRHSNAFMKTSLLHSNTQGCRVAV